MKNLGVVQSLEELETLTQGLLDSGSLLGFDVETGYSGPDREKGSVSIDWDQQFVVGFSITNDPSWARYVPLRHDSGPNLPEQESWEIVKPLLETVPSVAHNLKFETRNLLALGRKGSGPSIRLHGVSDSALLSYVLSETPRHGLKELVKTHFGHDQATLKSLLPDVADVRMKFFRFNALELSPETVSYACEDAIWTLELHRKLYPKALAENPFMLALELEIQKVLVHMEESGHAVDWEALREQEAYGRPFEEHMAEKAREHLGGMAGEDYSRLNFKSPLQMRKALYGDLGMTTSRVTKTGQLSTDAVALEGLSRQYPAVKKVLEVREVGNLANRLTKWVKEYSTAHDSRVHPSFNQVVSGDLPGMDSGEAVGSGRFSANDPSIQQSPKTWRWSTFLDVDPRNPEHWKEVVERSDFGEHYWEGNFRDFLIASPDSYLLTFDYSQIELRMLAGLAAEPYLIEAFKQRRDIHTATASLMLGMEESRVSSEDRSKGKTINFGIVFGMGAKLLAEQLAISVPEAEALLAQYMSAFTNVGDWIERQKRFGLAAGFVTTHFGRKVTLWDLQSQNFVIRGRGERLCVNAAVQGTAADAMKISMVKIRNAMERVGWWGKEVKMVNNVHDSLSFDVSNSVDPNVLREMLVPCVEWDVQDMHQTIFGNPGLQFPELLTDWEIGTKWGSSTAWARDVECVSVEGLWTPDKE